MSQVKYIGTEDTKVRVAGVKIDVAPGEVFEIENEEEATLLLNWPYRNYFIVDGAELTPKQNPENNKAPTMQIVGDEPKKEEAPKVEDTTPDFSEIIARIQNAESVDLLNEISTEVANDEAMSEVDVINDAIEAKMFEFLNAEEKDEGELAEWNTPQLPPQDETPKVEGNTQEETKEAKKDKKKAV